MEEQQFYLIYSDNGDFCGIFESEDMACKAVNDNYGLHKCILSDRMHKYILGMTADFTINANMIKNEETVIDSEDFFIAESSIGIDELKNETIARMKAVCRAYITAGCDIELSTGETGHFSFKIEDQINLSALVSGHSGGDKVYYHADGRYDTLYDYADVVTIYKTLYNNKLYNQIYTQILCSWINNNLTQEMLEEKQVILSYGYCDDEMAERIGEIYDSQKLL